MPITLETPLSEETVRSLAAGDAVRLNGIVYAARDAAHARLVAMLDRSEALPFDPSNAVVYYVGPTPGREGQVLGSAGPTTSYRMDSFAPRLMDAGVRAMIGKGDRGAEVIDAMRRTGAVYFAATGGAGALLAGRIVASEVIAFEDLGAEALRRLTVRDFPVTVAVDAGGASLYARPA